MHLHGSDFRLIELLRQVNKLVALARAYYYPSFYFISFYLVPFRGVIQVVEM